MGSVSKEKNVADILGTTVGDSILASGSYVNTFSLNLVKGEALHDSGLSWDLGPVEGSDDAPSIELVSGVMSWLRRVGP